MQQHSQIITSLLHKTHFVDDRNLRNANVCSFATIYIACPVLKPTVFILLTQILKLSEPKHTLSSFSNNKDFGIIISAFEGKNLKFIFGH